VSVVLDVLTATDAAIFVALGQLLDGGVIVPEPAS